MANIRLLVVEDDYDVAEMLVMYFTSHQYDVFHADSGSMGIQMARSKFPQIILLDVMMPDIDGYDTCRQLRQASLTKYIPIIFLTQRDERANRVKGLELGADDYITKPFDLDELRLRVQGAIRRATRESLHEARTGLPTSELVHEELSERPLRERPYTDLRLGLEGYKAYCDVYGFLAGNEVFAFAAKTVQQVISEKGTPQDFVGVLDDYFVILTEAQSVVDIENLIRKKFDEGVKAFYSFADVERGGLLVNPGTEREAVAPIMAFTSVQAAV
jgi:CheY-like chemotaxis protein